MVNVEHFGAVALTCVAAGVGLDITLDTQTSMDEDHILALVVFLCLLVCGISVFWSAWKDTHRSQQYAELIDVV